MGTRSVIELPRLSPGCLSLDALKSTGKVKKIVFFFLLWTAGITGISQDAYSARVQHYRDSIDAVFRDPEKSILLPEDVASFTGLHYYTIDPSYRVKAKFTATPNAESVVMKTSGTRTPVFKPYGKLTFTLRGIHHTLTIYQSADPARPQLSDYLLLAFTDETTGDQTYGGGRYLEFSTGEIKEEMMLDFNYCFNPYCAYNHKYSCVIPPAENSLNVPIYAGVKKYHD